MTSSLRGACSTAGSTARAPAPTSRSNSSLRSNPATSSSWTISEATSRSPSVGLSEGQAAGCGACRRIRPISTRSSWSRQDQTVDARPPAAHNQRRLRSHRPPCRSNPAKRMYELLRQRRIFFYQNMNRSSNAARSSRCCQPITHTLSVHAEVALNSRASLEGDPLHGLAVGAIYACLRSSARHPGSHPTR